MSLTGHCTRVHKTSARPLRVHKTSARPLRVHKTSAHQRESTKLQPRLWLTMAEGTWLNRSADASRAACSQGVVTIKGSGGSTWMSREQRIAKEWPDVGEPENMLVLGPRVTPLQQYWYSHWYSKPAPWPTDTKTMPAHTSQVH